MLTVKWCKLVPSTSDTRRSENSKPKIKKMKITKEMIGKASTKAVFTLVCTKECRNRYHLTSLEGTAETPQGEAINIRLDSDQIAKFNNTWLRTTGCENAHENITIKVAKEILGNCQVLVVATQTDWAKDTSRLNN